MNITKIFAFAAAAMALTACSNEDENLGGAPVAAQVDAEISRASPRALQAQRGARTT